MFLANEILISDAISLSIIIIAVLIGVVGITSAVVSVVLFFSYIKYNRRQNSAHITGVEAARKILDENNLQDIRVKTVGSVLFGNSYSHYFKMVRLRRLTRNKTSITSLAMGAQKASLAVLDKEGDPDMKRRIRLVPLITFGPFAFIPLIAIGIILDFFVFKTNGIILLVLIALGVLFYVFSLVLSIVTLKTEKKAQEKAYELLRQYHMANDDEIEDIKKIFRLYNIQYINDIILSALEFIYRLLQIVEMFNNNSKHTFKRK